MTQVLPPRPSAPTRTARLQHAVGRTPLGPALVAGVAVVGMLVLHRVDPNEPGHYPTCPFLALSGLYCPGCGTMRMLHHLGDGDVVEAFAMNPLGFVLVPALVAYWVQWARRTVTGAPRGAPLASWVVWLLLGVVMTYWVVRNLPGMELLAPG